MPLRQTPCSLLSYIFAILNKPQPVIICNKQQGPLLYTSSPVIISLLTRAPAPPPKKAPGFLHKSTSPLILFLSQRAPQKAQGQNKPLVEGTSPSPTSYPTATASHILLALNLAALAAVLPLATWSTRKMSAELDRLTTEVAETRNVVDSAILLIKSLADQIRDNADDPAALNALADTLDAQQADLAEAVAANTMPSPTPTA